MSNLRFPLSALPHCALASSSSQPPHWKAVVVIFRGSKRMQSALRPKTMATPSANTGRTGPVARVAAQPHGRWESVTVELSLTLSVARIRKFAEIMNTINNYSGFVRISWRYSLYEGRSREPTAQQLTSMYCRKYASHAGNILHVVTNSYFICVCLVNPSFFAPTRK